LANDLTLVQAIFIQALQGIVSRNVPARESVVVSVGHIAGGTKESLNVMPAELVVGGTMRAFNAPMQALVEGRIRELAELAAATQGATAEISMWWNAIPLVNHERETEVMAAAARAVAGEAGLDTATQPVTGGEDFAFMLQAKPGAFVFLGAGVAPDGTAHALHSPLYDFNDAALPHGVAFWVQLVRQELAGVA
uniref:M20/M25/M40 family metallo-hydrolase n=1 Tax=Rhodovarius sp. TaxID=2972673 RepID=UPI0034A0EDA9